jgi:hypothetical protein
VRTGREIEVAVGKHDITTPNIQDVGLMVKLGGRAAGAEGAKAAAGGGGEDWDEERELWERGKASGMIMLSGAPPVVAFKKAPGKGVRGKR